MLHQPSEIVGNHFVLLGVCKHPKCTHTHIKLSDLGKFKIESTPMLLFCPLYPSPLSSHVTTIPLHFELVCADPCPFVASLRACTRNKDLVTGTNIHDDLVQRGLLEKRSNALVIM